MLDQDKNVYLMSVIILIPWLLDYIEILGKVWGPSILGVRG